MPIRKKEFDPILDDSKNSTDRFVLGEIENMDAFVELDHNVPLNMPFIYLN